MPTVRRREFGDLIPAPTPGAVVTAVLVGAVFALIGLSIDRGETVFPMRETAPPRYHQALQNERQRTQELLRKIEAEVAAPSRSSLRPPVVVVRSAERRQPRDRPAPTGITASVWSAKAEKARAERRAWIDRELSRRASD